MSIELTWPWWQLALVVMGFLYVVIAVAMAISSRSVWTGMIWPLIFVGMCFWSP